MVECLNGMKPVSGAVFLAKKTNDSAVFALRKQTNSIPLIRSNTKTAFGRFFIVILGHMKCEPKISAKSQTQEILGLKLKFHPRMTMKND